MWRYRRNPLSLPAGSYLADNGTLVTSASPITLRKVNVYDSFNRADSAASLGNADTGQAWTVLIGTWGISGNQAYTATAVDNDMVYQETPTSNFSAEVLCTGQTDDATNRALPGVIWRILDGTTLLMTQISQGTLQLFKRDGGTFTALGSFAVAMGTGVQHKIRVENRGNSVQVYLNSVLRISYTLAGADTKYAGYTKAGMRYGKAGVPATVVKYDNFIVEGN